MKECIILAPGIRGGELKSSMARYKKNSMNLRVMSAGELAGYALMRAGIAVEEKLVGAKEECVLVARALEGVSYFGGVSYSDIQQITSAIRKLRNLVPEQDETAVICEKLGKGIFQEKNSAICSVYQKYMDILQKEHLVDRVSVIRRALAECTEMNADFVMLEEFPLSPLEKALMTKLSGGKCRCIGVRNFFDVEKKPLRIEAYRNCYGASCEVETILNDIYAERITDHCTVAVTEPETYSQLFFDYALQYDLPVTFGCGIPVVNSCPAKLLSDYYHWMTDGLFGADSLRKMMSGKGFDRDVLKQELQALWDDLQKDKEEKSEIPFRAFSELLEKLRFTNAGEVNESRLAKFKEGMELEESVTDPSDEKALESLQLKKAFLPLLAFMAEELAMPAEDFITKYARIRRSGKEDSVKMLHALDVAAAEAIYEELSIASRDEFRQGLEDIIPSLLKSLVCCQSSKAGAIHVTSIQGALSVMRPCLYVAGMSASQYPGAPKENYLLLDADLELFGAEAKYMTSVGKITGAKDILLALTSLASSLGSTIQVSYAGMNVSELKKNNASSLIYELGQKEKEESDSPEKEEQQIISVGYFEPAVSVTREIGKAYINSCKIASVQPAVQQISGVQTEDREGFWDPERSYFPSELGYFFGCQMKYFYRYILGIRENETERVFEVVPANEVGIMAHKLMEFISDKKPSREEFVKRAEIIYDAYIQQNPPVISKSIENHKKQFLEMMGRAFDMDPGREVVLREEDVHGTVILDREDAESGQKESVIRVHGYPDRVEKLEDGTCLIVDYKTGKRLEHVTDDIDSCLQVIVYAHMMEQRGLNVSGGEFRYPRRGEVVTCRYDDEMKENLKAKLKIFRDVLKTGSFATAVAEGDESPCRFCAYAGICGKNTGGDGDEQ